MERLCLHFNNGQSVWLLGEPSEATWEGRSFAWHPLVRAEDVFEEPDRWLVSLYVVAPELLPEEVLTRVAEEYCTDMEAFQAEPPGERHSCLADYGYALCVWEEEGPRLGPLIRQARRKLAWVRAHFREVLETPCNLVGHTGWQILTAEAP